MSDQFTVEIISPDQTILKQETNEVIIPSFEGQMGILNNHIPLITFLRPGIITIKAEGEKKYYVEEGTVEFSNNNLLILTSNQSMPLDFIIEASTPSPDVPLIKPKDVYILFIFLFIYNNICIIVLK